MQELNNLKAKIKDTHEWLQKELGQIRTGRATPAILDGVAVDAYGSMMPISQVATIASEDAKTLRIAPWDSGNIKPIEKAIQISGLGLSVAVDDKGLRVSFPPLTTESRQSFVKLAKAKLEDAKVAIRGERNKANSEFDEEKKSGARSEDEVAMLKKNIDELVKKAGEELEALTKKKEEEILG
jgi:ribosome recycling factor